jgi:hypothetical protein
MCVSKEIHMTHRCVHGKGRLQVFVSSAQTLERWHAEGKRAPVQPQQIIS